MYLNLPQNAIFIICTYVYVRNCSTRKVCAYLQLQFCRCPHPIHRSTKLNGSQNGPKKEQHSRFFSLPILALNSQTVNIITKNIILFLLLICCSYIQFINTTFCFGESHLHKLNLPHILSIYIIYHKELYKLRFYMNNDRTHFLLLYLFEIY